MAPIEEDPEAKYPKLDKETLLKKYNIPIQHLDFDYVEKCTDGSELEKILKILKSNEEGYFPALITATEERLAEIKPKSKLLRKSEQVLSKNSLDAETRHSVVKELEQWMKTMESYNEELESMKLTSSEIASKIRQTKQMQENENKKTLQRIKSTDYNKWAKYDADTEILKIELEEEKLKQQAEELQKKKNEKKPVNYNKHFATKAEAEIEANKEKQIGNEFYKANDYEEAIEHYTKSISAIPNTASYTNRALAYFKLKKYEQAINDCKQALKLEPNNLKAHLRLAECYELTNKYEEAIRHVDCAIRIEPNNKVAQKIARSLEIYRVTNGKKIRFKIVEAQSENNKKQNKTDENKAQQKIPKRDVSHNKQEFKSVSLNHHFGRQKTEMIAIPGTSKMSQPFFNGAQSEIPKKPLLINFVTVDNCSDDEDCTVNHLENRCSNKNDWKSTTNDSNNNIRLSKDAGSFTVCKKQEILLNDKGGGGEPCTNGINPEIVKVENLSSPYSFMNAWNSVKSDTTLLKKAEILQNLDPAQIEKGKAIILKYDGTTL